MLWIIGFWATISKMSTLENARLWYFFAESVVFLYFYPQYLTNRNSKAYQPYHFLKELSKIFQVHLNILPKLWLIFCCCRKQKKLAIFDILVTITLGVNMDTRPMSPFFSSTFWALFISVFHFCISRSSKFKSIWSPRPKLVFNTPLTIRHGSVGWFILEFI